MKSRRDFFRNTLGLSAIFAAAPRLFAVPHEGRTGMDMKHMGQATERGNSQIVWVETPDVPQLPWRLEGGMKEFHLVAEPVKQEIVPGRVIDLWGYDSAISPRRVFNLVVRNSQRSLSDPVRVNLYEQRELVQAAVNSKPR